MNAKSKLQKQVVDSLPPNPHGELHIIMRAGKTKIVVDLIKRDKPRSILWITVSSKLCKEDIPEEFKKWGAEEFLSCTELITYTYLPKVIGYYDWIILDESQKITSKNSKNLVSGLLSFGNIIAMTGSATKNKDKKEIFKNLNLNLLVNITLDDAVNIGVLPEYEIFVLTISPLKDLMAEYYENQRKIDNLTIGNYKICGDSVTLARNFKGTFKLVEGENVYGNEPMYWIVNNFKKLGYIVLFSEEETKGKLFTEELKYVLENGAIKAPCPKFLKIMSSRTLGESSLKTNIVKQILSTFKGKTLIFATSIKQSKDISNNIYNGSSDDKSLKAFVNGEINELVLVEKGGTGYTYTDLDQVILIQSTLDTNGGSYQKLARILLKQQNKIAKIYLIKVLGTQDEAWVSATLSSFNPNRIKELKYEYKS